MQVAGWTMVLVSKIQMYAIVMAIFPILMGGEMFVIQLRCR